MIRLIIGFLIYVLANINTPVCAQNDIPLGTWRTHYSFNKVNLVMQVDQSIYAAGENGMFIFDKQDNSITKLTKIDGLQGETISALQYDDQRELILVGYESGNLDLIDGRSIINFDLTTNSQVLGSKRINHISIHESFAYLSTDFGVLKFDLIKQEVKESYRELGLNVSGQPQALKVNMSATLSDSLFIATAQGVLAANLVENINLLDFRNWKRFDMSSGIPVEEVSVIANKNDRLIAGIDNDSLYTYTNGIWTATNTLSGSTYNSVHASSVLLIVADSTAYFLDENLSETEVATPGGEDLTSAIIDDEGDLWFGSINSGVVANFEGSFNGYLPSGPSSNKIFRLQYANDKIYGLPGGFSAGVAPLNCAEGFYVFENGAWTNFNSQSENNPILIFNDIVSAARFNNKTYLASAGYGLLEIDGEQQKVFDETNSPLVNNTSPQRDVRVPAIVTSAAGLWILNYGVNTVHLLNGQGDFSSFSISSGVGAFANDMIVVNNQLWLIIDSSNGGGIVVVDPTSGDSRHLTSVSGNGGLSSTMVNALALDKEGFVWAGSDIGVSVFSNPFSVISGSVDAVEPIFENRQLLRDEVVTDIEVDGGNRKWIGTESGVWLFDPEADRQIRFFNTDNSPLPSDVILDIEIHDKTGEVFFATPKGIISWRGTGTESEPVHTQVEIFPNPVRSDFSGTVGISGLATDANVKITDTSGKLIWQTKANGGTATWRVRDYNGSRASTGIYLVFSSTDDGEDTFVGKIAVVN